MHRFSRPTRSAGTALALLASALLAAAVVVPATAATTPLRTDLKVLLVSDTGNEPAIQAWAAQLGNEGVPFDLVRLSAQPLPALWDGANESYYQGVVLSNDYQPNMSATDRATLSQVEATFGLREAVAYAYPTTNVGLNPPTFGGDLAGTTAQVTPAGAATFTNLVGPVPVLDNVYGYLATPAAPSWQTLVQAPSGQPIVGSFTRADGVQELVSTIDSNQYMTHARLLGHGLLNWVTQGVHLGYLRSYLSVHIDDVFLPDARWSTAGHCTPGDGCPLNPDGSEMYPTTDIRMTPADVQRALQWQQASGVRLDMVYNGGGSDDATLAAGGKVGSNTKSDPLTAALVKAAKQFGWINHTYSHPFLGCVQDFTVVPWRCATDTAGNIVWLDAKSIQNEIDDNIKFAGHYNLPINDKELVTGEHSGLRTLPQQTVDNPNLLTALSKSHIDLIASDASREPQPRSVTKNTTTVPRYPNNTYYNVGTFAEELDEYNWLYVARGYGGNCVNTATTTCSYAPISYSQMVQRETGIMLGHVLGNDPRPTFMHQSNLAEDGTAYPVLNSVVNTYKSWVKVPLISPTMTQTDQIMSRTAAYNAALAAGQVSGYVLGGVMYLSNTGAADIFAPATVAGTAPIGGGWTVVAGEQSSWIKIDHGHTVKFTLP